MFISTAYLINCQAFFTLNYEYLKNMNDIQLLGITLFWQIQVFLILLTVYLGPSLVERRARYSVRESKG